ncbi:MAG: hypothetical protein GY783_17855, partial [Gammaproteobacteria bacterium]|nr:hypothetical protein [Gammaproteobacteria bacterium]
MKLTVGMMTECFSVTIAAGRDILRRGSPVRIDTSIAVMIVPYFLMGIGDIYTQPTLLHHTSSGSPPSRRTLAIAVDASAGGQDLASRVVLNDILLVSLYSSTIIILSYSDFIIIKLPCYYYID